MVGLGVDFADVPDYVAHNDLGTAVAARGPARAVVRRPDRPGQLDGRVRRGRATAVARTARCVRARARRAGLDAGRFEPTCPRCDAELAPSSSTRTPRWIRATCTPPPSSTRSTCARPTRASTTRRVIALRYHNVYGPRMPRNTPYAGVASIFRVGSRAGRAATGVRGRRPAPRLRPRHDVARANVLALEADRAVRGAFNVATGEPHTVLDMAKALADAIGPPAADWRRGSSAGLVRRRPPRHRKPRARRRPARLPR